MEREIEAGSAASVCEREVISEIISPRAMKMEQLERLFNNFFRQKMLKPRPESGLDCLMCGELDRQRGESFKEGSYLRLKTFVSLISMLERNQEEEEGETSSVISEIISAWAMRFSVSPLAPV